MRPTGGKMYIIRKLLSHWGILLLLGLGAINVTYAVDCDIKVVINGLPGNPYPDIQWDIEVINVGTGICYQNPIVPSKLRAPTPAVTFNTMGLTYKSHSIGPASDFWPTCTYKWPFDYLECDILGNYQGNSGQIGPGEIAYILVNTTPQDGNFCPHAFTARFTDGVINDPDPQNNEDLGQSTCSGPAGPGGYINYGNYIFD